MTEPDRRYVDLRVIDGRARRLEASCGPDSLLRIKEEIFSIRDGGTSLGVVAGFTRLTLGGRAIEASSLPIPLLLLARPESRRVIDGALDRYGLSLPEPLLDQTTLRLVLDPPAAPERPDDEAFEELLAAAGSADFTIRSPAVARLAELARDEFVTTNLRDLADEASHPARDALRQALTRAERHGRRLAVIDRFGLKRRCLESSFLARLAARSPGDEISKIANEILSLRKKDESER